MNRKPLLIDLPLVEFWLIPTIYVLIVGLLTLLYPQSLCSASCASIESRP